jgi:urease accessory protein
MHARARLVVALDTRGGSVAETAFGEAPLLLRVTSTEPLVVHLVGGAAGPLGGDRLTFDVRVLEGSSVTIRSIAASLAQPGPARGGSTATVTADVGADATMDWWPEPIVSVTGSEHTMTTVVTAARTARVRWVDEIVLGRHEEPGGVLTAHQRFVVAGLPLLHHTVRFDPSEPALGRHGTSRVAIAGIEIGAPARLTPLPPASSIGPGARVVRYPIGNEASAWIGVGADLDTVRAALATIGLRR